MKEIVYEIEGFKRIVEREKPDLELAKLSLTWGGPIDKHGVLGRLQAELYVPYCDNRILICEFPSITYDRIWYDSERRNKKEGATTKRIKEYVGGVKSQIREKLGIDPLLGRWEI